MNTNKKLWAYARNVFEIVTRFSYLLMYNISLKHLNALKLKAGDTFFDARITYYEPLHDAYAALFNARKVNMQNQQGDTQDFYDLIETLCSEKIAEWDIAIQGKFKRKTSDYKRLLPRFRRPFQTGTNSSRVAALLALDTILDDYTDLAALKTEVHDFYLDLIKAQNDQQQGMTNTGLSGTDLEPARIACAQAMMVNLGLLIAKYALLNLADVEKFFDVAAIQSHSQSIFVGHLNSDEFKAFIKKTFKPGQLLRITTSQNVRWFLSNTKKTFVGTMQETLAEVTKDINVDDFLVNLNENKNLIGLNLSGTNEAEIRIEIL